MKAICDTPGCLRDARRNGLCNACSTRKRRGRPLDRPIRKRNTTQRPCDCAGCSRPTWAKGLCGTHYHRRRRGCKDWSRPISGRVQLVSIPGGFKVEPEVRDELRRLATEAETTMSGALRAVLRVWLRSTEPSRYVRGA